MYPYKTWFIQPLRKYCSSFSNLIPQIMVFFRPLFGYVSNKFH